MGGTILFGWFSLRFLVILDSRTLVHGFETRSEIDTPWFLCAFFLLHVYSRLPRRNSAEIYPSQIWLFYLPYLRLPDSGLFDQTQPLREYRHQFARLVPQSPRSIVRTANPDGMILKLPPFKRINQAASCEEGVLSLSRLSLCFISEFYRVLTIKAEIWWGYPLGWADVKNSHTLNIELWRPKLYTQNENKRTVDTRG